MKPPPARSFAAHLKRLREAAGFTQEELATIAGLSVHAVSALERGERRRPQLETVRALSSALDLNSSTRDALLASARAPVQGTAAEELSGVSIPVPLTPLLGREGDASTLRQWLADPAARLITLIGPGGVGKTRLVLELARAVADEGTSRVVFLSLAAVRDPAFVAPAIAEALGLADVSAHELPRRARGACEDQPTLMVLDNFEHVLGAAPLVSDLLTSAAPLRLLVTSRAALRIRGEREYAIGPLALDAAPNAMSVRDLERSPAVRLFVERVRDAGVDFRLTAANSRTVAAICLRLDTLPLALELAASWMKVLTAEDLLRRLEHDVLLSTAGPRDLPERQQTMNATVAWSYQLLDRDEQRAFRHFGALPGLFPIDAAAAVLAGGPTSPSGMDDTLQAAAALIDKSLLVRGENSVVATCPLYQMLDTVRAYASLQLIAAGERDSAMEGLVHYCLNEAGLARAGLVGAAQVEWLDRVREDLESYRGALTWLLEHGRSVEASAIASDLAMFWLIRGHAVEGLQWFEQILSLPPLPPPTEARTLIGASLLCYSQGKLRRAREALTRAVMLAHEAGNAGLVAEAEHIFGHVELAEGHATAARQRFASSAQRFRPLAIPWGIGSAVTGLAWVALASGDHGRVEQLLDEATEVFRGAGPWFLSLVRYLRGSLAVLRGDASTAIALMRENLAHIRELNDKFAFVYALAVLADAAVLQGDDARAAQTIGARDAVTERTGAAVVDQAMHDLRAQMEREVRGRLGPRWALEYAAGRRTSVDALLNQIDRVT